MIFVRYVDEYIRTKVDKNRQLHAYETAKELWDFLEALDSRGLLRPSLRGEKGEGTRTNYIRVEMNADRILASFSKFYDMYIDDKKRKEFFKLAGGFGFTGEDLVHLLHSQLMFIFLLNTEMFKNWLTFVLKGIKPRTTLGQLFRKLIEQTQETGEALRVAKHLDIDLRNSLAHFMFREDKSTIYYYDFMKDGKHWILKEQEIENFDLFDKMREHNLLRTLFALVITDWYA